MKPTTFWLAMLIAVSLLADRVERRERSASSENGQEAVVMRKATIDDFAWLSGYWTTPLGNGVHAEEFCSTVVKGHMMCMFRALGAEKSLGLEFIVLQEKPEGVEERVRFFSPDLQPEDPGAVTLVLKSYSPSEMLFENASGGQPKRMTLRHPIPDEMTVHIEVDAQGKSSFIDAHWFRAPSRAEFSDALVTEGVVDAPVAEVWKVWTTKDGIESWMVAKTDINLAIGGLWRTSYSKDSNLDDDTSIHHAILAYDPGRLFSFRTVKPPKGFPFPSALAKTWVAVYFEPASEAKTRVTIRMLGYTQDDESQKMRAFFERGNRITMESLVKRFQKTLARPQ